jgi:hypothetical protein
MFKSFKNNETVYVLYSGVWQTATLISLDGKVAEINLQANKAVKENVSLDLGMLDHNTVYYFLSMCWGQ